MKQNNESAGQTKAAAKSSSAYDQCSVEELQKLQDQIALEIERKKENQILEAIALAKEVAKEVGFTLRQLADQEQIMAEKKGKRTRKKKIA